VCWIGNRASGGRALRSSFRERWFKEGVIFPIEQLQTAQDLLRITFYGVVPYHRDLVVPVIGDIIFVAAALRILPDFSGFCRAIALMLLSRLGFQRTLDLRNCRFAQPIEIHLSAYLARNRRATSTRNHTPRREPLGCIDNDLPQYGPEGPETATDASFPSSTSRVDGLWAEARSAHPDQGKESPERAAGRLQELV
jgi:hypothetical protein